LFFLENRPIEVVMNKINWTIVLTLCLFTGGWAGHADAANMCPVIALDVGHGGVDTGAISSIDKKTKEVDINRMFAQKLAFRLQRAGYYVINTTVEPQKRGRYNIRKTLKARSWLSNMNKADIFVSIHANSNKNHKAHGTEIYYYPTKPAKKLADLITKSVRKKLIKARPKPTHELFVLKHTYAPGVLIETGYLSNKYDLKRLKNPVYQNKLVDAIAQGILQMKHTRGCDIAKNRAIKPYTLNMRVLTKIRNKKGKRKNG